MKRNIYCPCERNFNAEIPGEIDLDHEPEIIKDICNGSFMTYTCPGCGKKHKPEFPVTITWKSKNLKLEVLPELDLTHIVSIIPTGMAGGYTMPLPKEDRQYTTKKLMEQTIVSLLGGRAAETLVIKDITTGASNDIERATGIARSMVVKYGMSDVVGPIQLGNDNEEVFIGRDFAHTRNYGEQVASMIDNEIKRLVEDAYGEALRILTEHIQVLHRIAELLLEREKMSGDEIRDCFPYGVLDQPIDPDSFEPIF